MSENKNCEQINIDLDCEAAINKAKKLYFEGSIFAIPTDTIYGFAANPFNLEAVKKISEIKNRDIEKKYIMLIGNLELLLKYIEVKTENHLDFLLAIWPNPVSVIFNLNSKTSEVLNAKTAAFRIPNNRFCSKLLNEIKMPLISTSVNRGGQPFLNDRNLIEDEFGLELSAIFFTEKKSFVQESTIIDLSQNVPKLIREGKIKFEDILAKYK